jgi:hypothetical protein
MDPKNRDGVSVRATPATADEKMPSVGWWLTFTAVTVSRRVKAMDTPIAVRTITIRISPAKTIRQTGAALQAAYHGRYICQPGHRMGGRIVGATSQSGIVVV